MFTKIVGLVFCLVISSVYGQVPGTGRCPEVSVKEDLKLEPYLGLWYTYQQYPTTASLGARCITAEYGLNPNGTLSVLNSQTDRNGQFESIDGHATVVAPGKLRVLFPTGSPVGGDYWVLSTDYDRYSVVYSCNQVTADTLLEQLWILTRKAVPEDVAIIRARSVIVANGVSLIPILTIRHENCAAPPQ